MGEIGAAGFTLLRTSYTGPGGDLTLCASQDIIGGTPNLIQGFGQTAGSFADLGLNPLSPPVQPEWDSKLLIARGTYVGDAADFHIDTRSVDLVANVFGNAAGTAISTGGSSRNWCERLQLRSIAAAAGARSTATRRCAADYAGRHR